MSQMLQSTLNGICPYFTMFPLEFPLSILTQGAKKGDLVLDPFCGRGTTNFAARLRGLNSLGVDSSPVAAAITAAKLVSTTADNIMLEAREILASCKQGQIPSGEFWHLAYQPVVLKDICKFREAFLEDCTTSERIALRGIILGSLHGPKQKTFPSYFSNQCPRTYAPKPGYAISYWSRRKLLPENVDVLAIIKKRADRYYSNLPEATGTSRLADSRLKEALQPDLPENKFNWVITSPPYYGMRTYIQDQWLRNWFLGGPEIVNYINHEQINHGSQDDFATDIRKVWYNSASVCTDGAKMVFRFGSISNRRMNPLNIVEKSLHSTGWSISMIKEAGSAMEGKRQADAFLRSKSTPMVEYDVWAILN